MPSPEELLQIAGEFRERAHAPYSRFRVGAALLMEGGRVFGGCNVENASYGLAICAERVAMASAVAAGYRDPVAIAVAGDGGAFCVPCGACRQFLAEFNPNLEVYLREDGAVVSLSLSELLPRIFTMEGK